MKIIKQSVAVILAIVIGLTASVNAFAATATKKYVSDVITYTASSADEAEKGLAKLGYKMVKDSNLNSTLKTGVYLGYKETDNPEEAITDLSVMNMKGKYSYSDYKQIMAQNREHINETISDFLPAVAEFQSNYEAEKPKALAAYKSLNIYKDDDSGKLMGDYLLEYDFTEGAEKKIAETFMQANTQYILSIMELTSFAGDDSDDTMIDRLVETGPDGIQEKYAKVYPTVAKANQAMAAEYGATATAILNDWNSLYKYICDAEKELVKPAESDDGEPEFVIDYVENKEIDIFDDGTYEKLSGEAKEAADAITTIVDYAENESAVIDCALYASLLETEYGDSTLLDFFKRPASEVKKEELYPLVDAMSDGQRSQFEMNGLQLTLIGAFSDIENGTQEAEDAIENVEKIAESLGTVSIFEGVDRSIFEEGIAFTSAATEHERLTGESWLPDLPSDSSEKDYWLKSMVITTCVSVALAATCIAAVVIQRNQIKTFKAALSQSIENRQEMYNLRHWIQENDITTWEFFGDELYHDETRVATEPYNEASSKLDALKKSEPTVGRTAGIVKCVSFVLFVAAFVYDIVSIVEFFSTDVASEEYIPHHIMSAAQTPYGEDYVYYQTVKNQNGDAADLNNHEGDMKIGWLVLYSTKDKSAGDPILSKDLKVVKGSKNITPDASFVSLFNESAAVNLTDEKYTGKADSTGGTYIIFTRGESLLTGSAVTNGTAALIGFGGLALGAVLGAVITKLAGRKKKEEAPAEA